MLPPMFGMSGTEILVILVVALLFLGPDKLPDAAKQISRGIRDLRKQTRDLQHTIEADEQIGGAIRDLKSALRGEEARPQRPPVLKQPPAAAAPAEATAAASAALVATSEAAAAPAEPVAPGDHADPAAAAEPTAAEAAPVLPARAGEADEATDLASDVDADAAAPPVVARVTPAPARIAKGDPRDHDG